MTRGDWECGLGFLWEFSAGVGGIEVRIGALSRVDIDVVDPFA